MNGSRQAPHSAELDMAKHQDSERAEDEELEEEDVDDDEDEGEEDGEDGEQHQRPQTSFPAKGKTLTPKKVSLSSLPFPLARVKRLINCDPDTRLSSEAAYVIAKAVGLFLEKFVEQSFEHMIDDRRHSLTYKDLATEVTRAKRFQFLSDFVPEKVTAAVALSEVQKE